MVKKCPKCFAESLKHDPQPYILFAIGEGTDLEGLGHICALINFNPFILIQGSVNKLQKLQVWCQALFGRKWFKIIDLPHLTSSYCVFRHLTPHILSRIVFEKIEYFLHFFCIFLHFLKIFLETSPVNKFERLILRTSSTLWDQREIR